MGAHTPVTYRSVGPVTGSAQTIRSLTDMIPICLFVSFGGSAQYTTTAKVYNEHGDAGQAHRAIAPAGTDIATMPLYWARTRERE